MKKFLFIPALFFCLQAHAMQTPVFMASAPSTTATRYAGFSSVSFIATDDTKVRSIAPVDGLAESFVVSTDVAPGAAKSYAITFEKNGADTAIACTITGAATTTCTMSGSIRLTAGDSFSIKSVPSGTPAAVTIYVSFIYNTGSGGPAVLIYGGDNIAQSTSVNNFTGLYGNVRWSSAASNVSNNVATGGLFKNLYIKVDVAPGAGTSYTYIVQKNSVDTALTCQVADAATSCNDTTHSFSVVATDLIVIKSTPAGTPSASTRTTLGMVFLPTIDGETPAGWMTSGSLSNSADRFYPVMGAPNVGAVATESPSYRMCPLTGIVARKLYVTTGSGPGTSKSYLHAFRIGGVSQTLTTTLTGSQTSNTDLVNSVTMTQNDLIDFISTPTNTPTAGTGDRTYFVFYIDPTEHMYGSTLYGSINY